ncbi:MAG: hypothetical protein ACXQS5_00850, partial [Candidatus Methanospirareceae archaeon]
WAYIDEATVEILATVPTPSPTPTPTPTPATPTPTPEEPSFEAVFANFFAPQSRAPPASPQALKGLTLLKIQVSLVKLSF